MHSLAVLDVVLGGVGWALLACLFGAVVAFFAQDSLVSAIEQAIDYEGLEVEEIATIEEARAELAQKARERAAKAQQAAEVAQYEAWAEMATYTPIWQIQPLTKWKSIPIPLPSIFPRGEYNRTTGSLLRAV
jgi:hypothetical protein